MVDTQCKYLYRTPQSYILQMWYETDKSELVLSQLLCLEAADNFPRLYKCHEMGDNQEWKQRGHVSSPSLCTPSFLPSSRNNYELIFILRNGLLFITWPQAYASLHLLQGRVNFSLLRYVLTKAYMNGILFLIEVIWGSCQCL